MSLDSSWSAIFLVQRPSWREEFDFEVQEDHHYLNICVWTRLGDDGGDLLVGHVSLSADDQLADMTPPRPRPTPPPGDHSADGCSFGVSVHQYRHSPPALCAGGSAGS